MKTLRTRLVRYFSIIIVLMSVLSIGVLYFFQSFYRTMVDMQNTLLDVHSIGLEIDRFYQDTDNYINSGNKEYLDSFGRDYQRLVARIGTLQAKMRGDKFYHLKDLRNMIESFREKRLSLIGEYDGGTERIYLNRSSAELSRLAGYIKAEVNRLLSRELNEISDYSSGFGHNLQIGENITYLFISALIVFCFVFAYRFSKEISVPIHALVLHLQRFAKGDLDIEPIETKRNDEIAVLVESFNHMSQEIKNLIGEMKEKANLERKLKEQEVRNLEMNNLLKQSELDLLQAQINPHFLFNTINIISSLAEIESADKTKEVLANMAHILRYNLKRSKDTVTLNEEIEAIHNYLHIQKTRFSNKIEYSVYVEDGIGGFQLPCMVLQPFVENAVIHGIEPKEEQCSVDIAAKQEGDAVKITIKDDGVGMDRKKLEELNNSGTGRVSVKHYFGILNVKRRLELFYGKAHISIESRKNMGTTVTLTLPIRRS